MAVLVVPSMLFEGGENDAQYLALSKRPVCYAHSNMTPHSHSVNNAASPYRGMQISRRYQGLWQS